MSPYLGVEAGSSSGHVNPVGACFLVPASNSSLQTKQNLKVHKVLQFQLDFCVECSRALLQNGQECPVQASKNIVGVS